MKNNQPGSVIVFIIIVLSVLGICVAGVWHSVVFALQISHKRQVYEQRYRATEGLMTYGLAVCKQQFEHAGGAGMTEIRIPSWPSGDGQRYDGLLTIARLEPEQIKVQAVLLKKSTSVCTISCLLKKK